MTQLEAAGFEVRDVEAIREHYALTLRRWVANLERSWAQAVRLTSPGRARVWRLYMAASALSFERNRIGVNQILAVRTPRAGPRAFRCAPASGAAEGDRRRLKAATTRTSPSAPPGGGRGRSVSARRCAACSATRP
ncbi:hypothetical protein SVIO_048900 [Streptomyces violaceusniger]|uniref:sphingolipid C(9)-methyltransferase n=1 Tax=Streptomyces violaceusniger TaxID=68280 RepID=A0A4D4L6I4_STRVO|nr:hypothetical protein SVIO_048900 [Streptomyces violaceusniger]